MVLDDNRGLWGGGKGGRLVPFQLDKWFDRLTTPRKIEGPNLSSLPCCKGRERVQRKSWHKELERH